MDIVTMLTGYRILIVDDHESNRIHLQELLRFFFEDSVFEQAENGEEAVQKVKNSIALHHCPAFDLIFMDYMMPVLNGEMAALQIQDVLNQDEKTSGEPFVNIITWSTARVSPFRGTAFALAKPTIQEDVRHLLIELDLL